MKNNTYDKHVESSGLTLDKKHLGGIRLQIVNVIMLIITVLVSALLLVANYSSMKAYANLRSVASDYIAWHKGATDLQNASDYLTEQVRVFVITGDKKYLDNYFNEANTEKRREKALEAIEAKTFGSESYDALERALAESYALMTTEYKAMKLVVIGKNYDLNEYPKQVREVSITEYEGLTLEQMVDKGREIVFDANYEREKEIISSNVKACLDQMDENYVNKQISAADDLSFMFRYEQILVIAYVLIVLTIIALVSLNVLIPLVKASPYLKAGDVIPVKGAYEYRYLAETYNRMHALNEQHKKLLIAEATHDALTGIYNRREFSDKLENSDSGISALILFDVDHFKQINDTNGHDVGDTVLKRISNAIDDVFGRHGYTCRIGGDEIAVLITDKDIKKQSVIDKASSINGLIADIKEIPPVTVSAGIAFYKDGMSNATLSKYADRALYTTKKNGRNGVTVYTSTNE